MGNLVILTYSFPKTYIPQHRSVFKVPLSGPSRYQVDNFSTLAGERVIKSLDDQLFERSTMSEMPTKAGSEHRALIMSLPAKLNRVRVRITSSPNYA